MTIGIDARVEFREARATFQRPGRLLDRIRTPADLRRLPASRLPAVAAAVRQEIVDVVSKTGGHLGAGLGVVELTTALHYVFDTPRDRLIFDVGHQGYPHKLLTGRRDRFETLGRAGGVGKFLRRKESPYDVFGAGHAGTSISAAVGIADAIAQRGGDERVVAVIGDGALTSGMAYEGLNHAGFLGLSNLVVVLNDNRMSISPNVGALSRSFDGRGGRRAGNDLEAVLAPRHFFHALGFDYLGPVDGHDLPALLGALRRARNRSAGHAPIVVHCRTQKGHGYDPAQADPVRYHGVSAFEPRSGRMRGGSGGGPSWTSVFAEGLVELASEDPRIVAITAAMADGTGLSRFRDAWPDRFYDVGIAEQHAVTMAAGMATEGLKPVCAIYSTFLQRAFDQVVHDVCIQNLDVTFALDRGGLVGADGATHQGVYDFAYLRSLPNFVVMAPKDREELRAMLRTAIEYPGPAALRYPRGTALGEACDREIRSIPIGKAELLNAEEHSERGTDVALIAVGSSVAAACAASERLAEAGIEATVLNARFIKPLDEESILALVGRARAVVTVEEHVEMGGFGESVVGLLARQGPDLARPLRVLALPDRIFEQGDRGAMLAQYELDADGIAEAAIGLLR